MKTRKKNRAPLLNLARKILRQETSRLLTHEPLARLQKTPEAVHQVRVACRRLRAALKLLKPLLPPHTLQLQPELKWLAQNLGPARDADVLTEHTLAFLANSPHPHPKLKQQLTRTRTNAYRHMQQTLQSQRCQSLLQHLKTNAENPLPQPIPNTPLAKLIQPLHQKLLKACRKTTPTSPPTKIHRLRIHAKRLRYALEFTSTLSSPTTKSLRLNLIQLQDQLGLHQDAITSQTTLTTWANSTTLRLPPPTTFLLGQLHQALLHSAKHQLTLLPESIKKLRTSSWKSLKPHLTQK